MTDNAPCRFCAAPLIVPYHRGHSQFCAPCAAAWDASIGQANASIRRIIDAALNGLCPACALKLCVNCRAVQKAADGGGWT
jgi:hypothetical protein